MEIALVKYLGNLRTEAIHLKSQNKVITDAPIDNHGKGEAFSPTDALATSLATCMITIMGILAKRNNIVFEKVSASVSKIMAENPRRVAEIIVQIRIEHEWKEKYRKMMEKAALNCPVAHSLRESLKQTVHFNYTVA